MTAHNLRAPVFLALALVAGCSGQQHQTTQRTPPADAQRVDESKAGRIAGRVAFEGAAPENPPINTGSDPVCARENKDGLSVETVVVENGGLNNVFVYVKDGLGKYYFDVPAQAVTVDQQGCRYRPHVFGVRAGQPIEINNSDPTLHNVNAVARVNRGFNFGQPMQGMKNTATFTAPEVMVRIKCDVHGWMNTYAGVLDHPYFAVTSSGGKFELKNVPAGTYTVEAWHEKLGAQTQNVTLAEKDSKELSFIFKGSPATP
jgi:plastocyanin